MRRSRTPAGATAWNAAPVPPDDRSDMFVGGVRHGNQHAAGLYNLRDQALGGVVASRGLEPRRRGGINLLALE